MSEWETAPPGTVLLKRCSLHGWMETVCEFCPMHFDHDVCDEPLDPAEPFVPLMAYDEAKRASS